jgi:hypothetical protein
LNYQTEVKVFFSEENVQKCLCVDCPVQANSQCIKEKSNRMGEVTVKFLNSEILPGLYCSGGAPGCDDIDTDISCICGACDVYHKYRLGGGQPLDHYCKYGSAR